MDKRVFGPYYGTPPEDLAKPTRSEQPINRPTAAARSRLRRLILTGRKPRSITRSNRT